MWVSGKVPVNLSQQLQACYESAQADFAAARPPGAEIPHWGRVSTAGHLHDYPLAPNSSTFPLPSALRVLPLKLLVLRVKNLLCSLIPPPLPCPTPAPAR